MNSRKSNSLVVKDFSFIKVQAHDANVDELMLFSGLPPEDLEQEKIYHFGGSPYMIGSRELVEQYEGGCVIKWGDSGECQLFSESELGRFLIFNDGKKKTTYPKLMSKEMISWIANVEQYHEVNSLKELHFDATVEQIEEAYSNDRYTLIGIGEALLDAAKFDVENILS